MFCGKVLECIAIENDGCRIASLVVSLIKAASDLRQCKEPSRVALLGSLDLVRYRFSNRYNPDLR